jgi:predicted anti-sigma-YlaC factor YlaD
MYANAFVQSPAEMLPLDKYLEKAAELERAKKLFLRGADILYSGLDLKYPGFGTAFERGTLDTYLSRMKKDDVPYLYWAVAGVLSAFSLDSFNMGLGVRIPELKAMIERAYALDPDFNNGALDDFFIIFYSSLPENLGGDKDLVFQHFQRAVEKSKGLSASPYVSYAKSVAVPAQDYATFREMLENALAIDPDADPSNRLINVLSLQKARFLLDNAGVYFVSLGSSDYEWDLEGWEWNDEW